MPEGEAEEMAGCKNFDSVLEQVIGTPVHWDDRESLLIENPLPDTISRIQQVLIDA
jgi:hypothetical protein